MAPFSPFRSKNETVLCEGGIGTALTYKAGMELREHATFEALEVPKFAEFLKTEETMYCRQGLSAGFSVALATPTYRASTTYFDKLGTPDSSRDAYVAKKSVDMLVSVRDEVSGSCETGGALAHIYGSVGPLGDGYSSTIAPRVDEARVYHRKQVRALAAAGVDAICCFTFTSSNEAVAVAMEAADAQVPCEVSFTLGSDGRLPCGETLGEAITAVDSVAVGNARLMYFGVNCVHPSVMWPLLKEAVAKREAWLPRLKAFRGNASAKSHEELAASDEIDEGNPREWAEEIVLLRKVGRNAREFLLL